MPRDVAAARAMIFTACLLAGCICLPGDAMLHAREAAPPPAKPGASGQARAEEKTGGESGKEPGKEDGSKAAGRKPRPSGETQTIVVTATRNEENIRNVPQSVTVVTREAIQRRQPRTPTQALSEEPGVFVNQVNAQGSPIVRGQIGNRVVYLWDGIRINNGALFGGPNGFFNQFPLGAVDRMEVIRGPGSVQYGSDAIGGVINVMSKPAVFAASDKFEYGGDVYSRYGTNDQEFTEYADLRLATRTFAMEGGVTKQDNGDYRGPGEGALEPSAFNALGGYLNAAFRPAEGHTLRASWIQNRRDDVDSYVQSKLNANGVPRLFTPTERRGIAKLDYTADNLGFLSKEFSCYGYFQYYDQLRERRVHTHTGANPTFTNTRTAAHQDVWGAGVQNVTEAGRHRFIYGIDYRSEDLSSANLVYTTFLRTGVRTKTKPLGKTPDGTYGVFDAYATAEFRPIEPLLLSVAGRFERDHLDANPGAADVLPNAGFTFADIDIEKVYRAFTWSAGVVYNVTKEVDLAANVATGFRSPTFSDTLSFGPPIFNSRIASLPSPGVEPEKSITFEFGPRFHTQRFSATLTGYVTRLRDLTFRTASGQVTITGVTYDAQHTTNKSRGVDKGIEAAFSYRFLDEWTLWGNGTYTEGRDTYRNDWFRFVPPLNGTIGIRYEAKSGKWWAEAAEQMVDRLRRPAHDDEGDAGFSHDPALGSQNTTNNRPLRKDFNLPGYAITNLRGGVNVWKDSKRSFDVTIDVNNVLNARYREPYSQQEKVAPGINGIIGARFRF